jgi:signal transduction histidine kinase
MTVNEVAKPSGSTTESSFDHAASGGNGDLPAWRRYAGALLCILVAFCIRYWLTPLLGEELPFMLFIAASLVAAWYGGAVAGIVALLLGLFLADYFFLARAKGDLSHPAEALYFVRYIFTASLGIGLIETLHRSRRRLQGEVARRKRSEAALLKAQAQLRTHAEDLEHCVAKRTAELAATVKYLESLLYHIGHNLRAPLRAMEGYATVLVDEYSSKLDATAKDYSAHISDAARRMDELIHDLLEYGRLGYIELPRTAVNVDQVLQRVLFRLGFEIRARQADVRVDPVLPEVLANAEMLEQVLTNLIENAVQFVAPGVQPVVRIRAEAREALVRLWVEDNGIGIAPAYRQRIFEVFETLGSPGSRVGTGMGLAVVKQGMQRMGGEVGVESDPGAGSRFWIELPIAVTPEEVVPPELDSNAPAFNGTRHQLKDRLKVAG